MIHYSRPVSVKSQRYWIYLCAEDCFFNGVGNGRNRLGLQGYCLRFELASCPSTLGDFIALMAIDTTPQLSCKLVLALECWHIKTRSQPQNAPSTGDYFAAYSRQFLIGLCVICWRRGCDGSPNPEKSKRSKWSTNLAASWGRDRRRSRPQ
jgi:hypothetical protein